MKSKQEVIQEAWGEYWDGLSGTAKEYSLQNNGFINSYVSNSRIPNNLLEFDWKQGFRPRVLTNIESNNGWLKVKDILPTDKGRYHCIYNGEYKEYFFDGEVFRNILWEIKAVTHFQPIIKPEAPIY